MFAESDTRRSRAQYWRLMETIPWSGKMLPAHKDGAARRAEAFLIEDACDKAGIVLTGLESRTSQDEWRIRIEPPGGDQAIEITGDHQYVIKMIPILAASVGWELASPFVSTLVQRQRAGERGCN